MYGSSSVPASGDWVVKAILTIIWSELFHLHTGSISLLGLEFLVCQRTTNIQWWIQNGLEKEVVEGLSCCSWQGSIPLPSLPLLLHPFSWGWLVGSWHPRGPAPSSSPPSSSEFWNLVLDVLIGSKKMSVGRKRRCHAQGLPSEVLFKVLHAPKWASAWNDQKLDLQIDCVAGAFWGGMGRAFTS